MSDELELELESSEDDVSLDPEDKKHAKSNQAEWFKGEKSVSYRAALVYFHSIPVSVMGAAKKKAEKEKREISKDELVKLGNAALAKVAEKMNKPVDQLADYEKLDLRNARFKKVDAHFKEGFGYVNSRLGKDGPDADRVWKTLGDPKRYFTTLLLLYPTNRQGEVVDSMLATNWVLKPWRFAGKIYQRLHAITEGLAANKLTMASQDLKLTCTNTDFQNFDIDGAGPAVWLKSDNFRREVLKQAIPFYSKLSPFRDLSTADLRIKLGMESGAVTDVSTTDDLAAMQSYLEQ